ncbi:MAG TPA: ABC transporter permease, partial [Bacilli bacterium]|nr:ABC transporter permease [Bacilli bacterium]
MRLLFLNSLKSLKKKKIQMLGIILLVMLSTGIYVAISSALDRMEDKYYDYLETQRVEHISVDYNIDYKEEVTKEDLNYLKEHELSNLNDEEKTVIDRYSYYLDHKDTDDLFTNLSYPYILGNVFVKHQANEYIEKNKMDYLAEKYDFEYEMARSKTLKADDTYLKVLRYDEKNNINKAYIIEGRLPKNDKEITMLPKYAKAKNIELNDTYTINDVEYKVVGFAYAPDYIYPLVNYSALVFDEETNNVVYMYKDNYESLAGVEEKSYSIFYHGKMKRQFDMNGLAALNDLSGTPKDDDVTKLFYGGTGASISIFAGTRMGRISSLQLEFATDRLFAEYFLYVLLGIAVFVIAIITKKRIEDEKLQIGVLKSLGYSPFSIGISYLVYPIIGSIIGGLLGYTIGSLVNGPIAGMYISFFLVPLAGFSINPKYIINCLAIPTILLSILSYIIALFMLRKKPLYLLREGSNLKINIFSRLANRITSVLPFKYRFKYSLAFRSLSKLIIVAITSFFTGMLIVLTLIGMNLMNDLIEKSFSGMKYNYMIYTNTIESEKFDEEADHIINAGLPIKLVTDKDGKEVYNRDKKAKDDKISIAIIGIDKDSKYVEIKDKDNNDLLKNLNDKELIINRNMENLYGIREGDTMELCLDEKCKGTISYKVVGIAEEFMNISGYALREDICKTVGFKESCYSSMLSNDSKYSDLNKLDD